jgi:hypothetical protein
MAHVIFYSWQSDLPNSTNRGFIQSALEQAVESLAKEGDPTIEPVLDRDTAGVAGSPDIGQTIFAKIENATALVCDVSIINSSSSGDRPTPNPNVLIELGFGLKAMGPSKIIMVMNTHYGTPETLPFDLKQKRVITYNVAEPETNKANSRRVLGQTLAAAIKAILIETQRESKTRAEIPPHSTQSVETVRAGRADAGRVVGNFMSWLAGELKKLDPHGEQGEPDENLVQAISKTMPLVQDFEKVADAVSAMNSEEGARALYKGFENIMTLCYHPEGFSGTYKTSDFDLFKFIANELLTIFAAYLIRDRRWTILHSTLQQALYVKNAGGNPLVTFQYLSSHVILLDEIRNSRLATGGTKRISIHADLLKERHDKGPLAGNLTWEEFMDADLILFLLGYANSEHGGGIYWWPRTGVYLGSHVPRFLAEATTKAGAKHLTTVLGLKDTTELRDYVKAALEFLLKGLRQMGCFFGFWNFDPNKIAVSD